MRKLKLAIGHEGVTVFGHQKLFSGLGLLTAVMGLVNLLRLVGFEGYITIEGSMNEE